MFYFYFQVGPCTRGRGEGVQAESTHCTLLHRRHHHQRREWQTACTLARANTRTRTRTQARTNPDRAPLVIWMTGGPGCSSELAVLYGGWAGGDDGCLACSSGLACMEGEHVRSLWCRSSA